MNNDTKIMKRALNHINVAAWEEDSTGTLNLYVEDAQRRTIHCWMTLRPLYCDRGHIQLNIDGVSGLDGQDRFPRFFFSFAEADHHCRTFLKWRLWKHRSYAPGWGDFGDIEVRHIE